MHAFGKNVWAENNRWLVHKIAHDKLNLKKAILFSTRKCTWSKCLAIEKKKGQANRNCNDFPSTFRKRCYCPQEIVAGKMSSNQEKKKDKAYTIVIIFLQQLGLTFSNNHFSCSLSAKNITRNVCGFIRETCPLHAVFFPENYRDTLANCKDSIQVNQIIQKYTLQC